MKKLEFGIDCDEVLAEFRNSAFDLIKNLTGRSYSKSDMTEWDMEKFLKKEESSLMWDFINESPNFIKSIKPCEGAKEAIGQLKNYGDIFIITAPIHKCHNFMLKRNKWLLRHFNIEPKNIIYAKAKYLVNVDLFIDDHPDNIEKWVERNKKGKAILWSQPYNNFEIPGSIRTDNWNIVIDIVKNQLR